MLSKGLDAVDAAAAPGHRKVGRYVLRHELGRGAQAIVWLAHDPRLQRDVALKVLSAEADAATREAWLHEARAVSGLKHPHVVPVFEADDDGGQHHLVFEYVEGGTLAQRLKARPRVPAREAVALMLGVLDALKAAHDQGIVHRDLKPSNILLGGDGRPRVMDFGIAARVSRGAGQAQPHDGRIVGTPGYISPEAARGDPPAAAMDVFAAGVVLGEMLSGAPLLRERDPWRAIQRVQEEDLLLPVGGDADEALRAIVQRALARDPHARFDTAQALQEALEHWLNPEHATLDTSHATLEFLLRRMRHKSDFPALSASVSRIQRLAGSDTESMASLSDEILKDVSLTNKLLRMVNTVHFTAVSGEQISTVSRAVALVGMAGIRNMALSVILFEHMQDKAHAALLKEEFLRAMTAGTLASDLVPLARQGEEAFLAAMFHNLGRLLTEYYFPEEAQRIRQQAAVPGGPTRDAAARRVLGLSLQDLGVGVARAWGLPESLQKGMRQPEGELPTRRVDPRAQGGIERMRWLAQAANDMADALLAQDGAGQLEALAQVADRYATALGLEPRTLLQSAQVARVRMADLVQAMGLQVAAGSPARRLLHSASAAPAAGQGAEAASARLADGKVIGKTGGKLVGKLVGRGDAAPADATALAEGALADAPTLAGPAALAASASPLLRLSGGLETVRSAVHARSMRVNDVLALVLNTLHRALDLRCVVFCLRDARQEFLLGRVAVGALAPELPGHFRIPLRAQGQPDLFAAVCQRGADLLVADSRTVEARLPGWFRQQVAAPTFLLLSLQVGGAPVGLIYADRGQANSMQLGEAELALVKGLRDQAVLALSRG